MILPQHRRQAFGVGEQVLRVIVTRVSSRQEDRVEPGARFEESLLFVEEFGFLSRVRQDDFERNPGPMIEIVLLAKFAELRVDEGAVVLHHRRATFMQRSALDRVGSEDHHVAEILFELLERPRIVAVGCRPIADLVPPDRAIGREVGTKAGRQTDGTFGPFDAPQQLAHAKHHAARIVAKNQDGLAMAGVGRNNANVEPFGLVRNGLQVGQKIAWEVGRPIGWNRANAQCDDRSSRFRPATVDRPGHTGSFRDFFREDRRRDLLRGSASSLADHDRGTRQINRVRRGFRDRDRPEQKQTRGSANKRAKHGGPIGGRKKRAGTRQD